jgi:predicted secreted protein
MRKLFYLGIVGILLSLLAIAPVMAFTPETPNIQNELLDKIILHTNTFNGRYFSHISLNYSENGWFSGSSGVFKPIKPVSTNSHFSSYIKTGTADIRTFTESDNGKSITLTKGQVIKVQLNENPTTGYRWEPTVSSGIQVTDDTYVTSASRRMGAGGIHTWTLKITGSGDQHFNAEYKRSWESGSADSYSLQFVVS